MSFEIVPENAQCVYCAKKMNLWDFLDKAYVITLNDRKDRTKKAEEELHRVGLCQVAEFFMAERSKKGFLEGCWDSHLQVARKGLEVVKVSQSPQPCILVLEDDFEFDTKISIEDLVKQTKLALDKLPMDKWTRLMLGHITWFSMYYSKGVRRSVSLLTHAFIWSPRGMEWMVSHPSNDTGFQMDVDQWMSMGLLFSYSMTPMIAFQRDLQSDHTEITISLQSRQGMEGTEIWIPLLWICGSIVMILCCVMIAVKIFHLRVLSSLFTIAMITVLPFVILQILIVTNTI